MGPPELPGGNDYNNLTEFEQKFMLQWGRRNYPAETRRRLPRRKPGPKRFNGAAGITRRKQVSSSPSSTARSSLQWGRRNYPAETNVHKVPGNQHTVASMGPPELPGGNWSCAGTGLLSGRSASMGPPELPGGNAAIGCAGPAVALLQWGRRNYPAETGAGQNTTPPIATCFNGAAGITRRKRQSGRNRHRMGRRCFNGAAGITRRKHPKTIAASYFSQSASMGPPELPGGNSLTKFVS